jgi:hypothetical protein
MAARGTYRSDVLAHRRAGREFAQRSGRPAAAQLFYCGGAPIINAHARVAPSSGGASERNVSLSAHY